MLKFKMTTHSGMLLLPSPVTVVYNSEFSVPADDVTVEFPYIKGCEDGDFLYGFDGENLVFKGQIDEIITKSSGEKITVKFRRGVWQAFCLTTRQNLAFTLMRHHP